MGMSSSQARLLTLTGRMHDIERKAAKIQADKLRLANDSRRVQDDYLNVLDSTKIQYSSIMQDGSIGYNDATLAALENGAVPSYKGLTSSTTYLVRDPFTEEILVTPEFAEQFGITSTGDVEDVGTLEQYLINNGAHVKPSTNNMITEPSQQDVNDADTYWYSFTAGNLIKPSTYDEWERTKYNQTGSVTPAEQTSVTNAVINYSEIGSLGDISISDYFTEEFITAGNGPVSNTSTVATKEITVVDKTITHIPANMTYREYVATQYQFTQAELNSTIGELEAANDIDINWDTDYVTFKGSLEYKKVGNYSGYSNPAYWEITKDSVLKDVLAPKYDMYEMSFDESTGIYKSTNPKEYLEYCVTSWTYTNEAHTSANGARNTEFNKWLTDHAQIIYGETKTWSLDTNMQEYMNSQISKDEVYGGFNVPEGCLSIITGSSFNWSDTGLNRDTATYREYLNYMQNDGRLTYSENADGSVDITTKGTSLWSLGAFPSSNCTKSEITTTTNTKTETLYTSKIAENIYLGRAIIEEQQLSEYSNNKDSKISAIKSYLDSADLKSVAILNKELTNALIDSKNGNNTTLASVMAKVENFIENGTYTPNSENANLYQDNSETAANGNTTITKYIFKTSDETESYTPAIDPKFNKGSLTNVPAIDDIKEFFAFSIWDKDKSKTYDEYKEIVDSYTLDEYQWSNLYKKYYDNQSDNSILNALKTTGSNLEPFYTSDWNSDNYTISLNSDSYTVKNLSTPEYRTATTNTRDNIISELAYKIYAKNELGKTYPEKQVQRYKEELETQFTNWGYTDEDIYSISSYFGNDTDYGNIINNINNKSIIDNYTHTFDDYNGNDNFNFVENDAEIGYEGRIEGTDDHHVNMDSITDIAVKLAQKMYELKTAGIANIETVGLSDYNVENNVDAILSTFNERELASLNYYADDSSAWTAIATKLNNNISKTSVSEYLDKYTDYSDFRQDSTDYADSITKHTIKNSHKENVKGSYEIPALDGIASNLYIASVMTNINDTSVNNTTLYNKLNSRYGSDTPENNETLCAINQILVDYINGDTSLKNKVDEIYNHILNGSTLNITKNIKSSEYNINRTNVDKLDWVKDDLYYELVEKYNNIQKIKEQKFRVVSAELANSTEYISNIIEAGAVIMLFDSQKSIKELKDTSVSVETNLQEVSNEKKLKQAEAKYEADMKRIDMKDRRYDTDLAALDAERNATKQEMETLKTVAKDNVDRTFKLFG